MEQRLRLGQLLVDASIISQEQLDDVLLLQRQDGRKLGTLLVERELINETQLTQILSQQLSVPWVSLYHVDFSRRLLSLVPREVAEKFCLVPIYVRHVRGQGDTLYVAMDDPTNDEALKACSMWSGLPTRAMIASPSDIRNAIRVYYPDARRASVPPTALAQDPTPVASKPQQDSADREIEPPPAVEQPSAVEPQPPAEAAPVADQVAEAAPVADQVAEAAPKGDQVAESTEQGVDGAPAAEPYAAAPDHPKQVGDAASVPQPAAETAMVADATLRGDSSTEQPTAEGHPREPSIPPEPESASAWTPAAVGQGSPIASATNALEDSVPLEAQARTLDPGTLDPGSDPSSVVADSLPPPAVEEQITLEVGAEIPLEDVLPEGRSIPRKRPMTGAERLMSLTLLDGTTLALPVRRLAAKKRAPTTMVQESRQSSEATPAPEPARPASEPPRSRPAPPSHPPSHPPPPPSSRGPASQRPARLSQPPAEIVPAANFSARDVVAALRASAHGVDPTDILGVEPKWQAILAALLSLMLRKGLIDEQELWTSSRRSERIERRDYL